MDVSKLKPPMPVEVVDLKNFARLALGLVEEPPLIWHIPWAGKSVLGIFAAYMYWEGDLPLFAYVAVDEKPGPFLAYRSSIEKGEELTFTQDLEDRKFSYSPVIDVLKPSMLLKKAISGTASPKVPEPMLTQLVDLSSIMRTLLLLSMREPITFPLWHFTRGKKHILGTCIPFEHYYEADALPVFFYVKLNGPPEGSFIRYKATKNEGRSISYSTGSGDTKYFYAKIIDVKDLPIFP